MCVCASVICDKLCVCLSLSASVRCVDAKMCAYVPPTYDYLCVCVCVRARARLCEMCSRYDVCVCASVI